MTAMYHDRVSWLYTRDDTGLVAPTVFKTAVLTAVSTQVGGGASPIVGGSTGVGSTKTGFPRGFKPRVALVQSAAGLKRRVVCFESTAPLYIGSETTINLPVNSVSTAFTRYGCEGERQRGGENDGT